MTTPKYETLEVSWAAPHVWHVKLNRPKKLNAMNDQFFKDLRKCFTDANEQEDLRVIILTGNGKHFCAGLDLMEYGPMFQYDNIKDHARAALKLYDAVKFMQNCFLSVLECRIPVIVGAHNASVGGSIDLMSMCDIRYCTQDAKLSIKQVDIGMAADLGTLQLFPQLVGNDSFFRQLAYTGKNFSAEEALKYGFVSKVFANVEKLHEGLLETAKMIASKSPVAIYTIKQVNVREMKRRIADGMDFLARMNTSMLVTGDMQEAIRANLSKDKATFPKL